MTASARGKKIPSTSDKLTRFGVAMETSLLVAFDHLIASRGTTRSEALRDLVRAEMSRAAARSRVKAVAALTLVYDHHVRALSDRLTEMQHQLGARVRSTMHVHLDSHLCLEVIILQGRADQLGEAADRLFSLRGVLHGGIEIVALGANARSPVDATAHEHPHPHDHAHPPPRGRAKRTKARRSAF